MRHLVPGLWGWGCAPKFWVYLGARCWERSPDSLSLMHQGLGLLDPLDMRDLGSQIPGSLPRRAVVWTVLWDLVTEGPDTRGAGIGIPEHRNYLLGSELRS